jgi:Spy/CpxP family protein refolding chaperone
MKKSAIAVLFAIASVAAPIAFAQDKTGDVTDMQALRAAVKGDKKAFVAKTLDLTPAEAKKFWPIYDMYQRAIEANNRKRALVVEAVVAKDQDLTNAYAKNLATEAISNDEAEIRARRALQNRLMKALPPIKAARYLQLESKIRALQEYDIASTIPLVR